MWYLSHKRGDEGPHSGYGTGGAHGYGSGFSREHLMENRRRAGGVWRNTIWYFKYKKTVKNLK